MCYQFFATSFGFFSCYYNNFYLFLLLGVFDLNVWYRNILEFSFLLVNIYIYGLSMNEKYNELYIYFKCIWIHTNKNTIETQ